MTETEDTIEHTINIDTGFAQVLEQEAEERGIEVEEVLSDWFNDGFYIATQDVEESVVRLRYIEPWTETDTQIEPPKDGEETDKTLKTLRRLRDEFPPVTAGVEYAKSFTAGGGFVVDITDSNDSHQIEVQKSINQLNRTVFQDVVTIGLDSILDILLDEAFTVGCAAAEIVYKRFEEPGSLDFDRWATKVENPPKGEPEYNSKNLTPEDWKSLGGVVQLKIIANSVQRMKAYRNPTTYKIEYWTIDEDEINKYNANPVNKVKKVVPKLLPWQVLWLSWGRRGSNLKGVSLIRPAAETAILLEKILAAVGLSFRKWSDKKHFFVLGSDKTGRSWAPPKIRNFLHDVNKMTKEGGTGIAVPAGFGIETIGGDVFEGGQIIDTLVSLICGGMRYPRTFLEQGKTQEGDKAWLAWIVTYASHQKLLRRAIEHQLWARHIYSTVGTTHRLSKQGVPVEKQEIVPIYVPRMSWKSEGKWHIQQKIEELTKILNVANPVGGELKLEVEADLAVTLGYSDLDLNNSRKVLDLRQKISLIETKMDLMKAEMKLESLEKAKEEGVHLEMVPMLGGMKHPQPEDEEPKEDGEKRPVPKPGARLEGGVSRTPKDEETKKGVAKPLGGTRQPKVRA